jgi:signal transduction histidine kinase
LTRSRKATKRLGPDATGVLAAHVQGQLEAEKARIARRLHGDVAGMLAAARMDLSRMASLAGASDEIREQVARVDQILEAVIQNARSEMQRLHPALLDHFGLAAALRHLVEQACRTAGAEYTLELPEYSDGGVPSPVALAAYRTVERLLEGLPLRRVSVRLREIAQELLLCLEIETTSASAMDANGNDLLALRAWLESLGAAWTETHRGAQFELELKLPRVETDATATSAS